MSIAVLREFISKRKQEHEAKLSKRNRSASNVVDKDPSQVSKEGTPSENGEHQVASEQGQSSASRNTEGAARRELQPPKVLEVFLYSLLLFTVLFSIAYF